jgi:hypothetical protein
MNDSDSYSNLTQAENDKAITNNQKSMNNMEEKEYILESEEMDNRYRRYAATSTLRPWSFSDYSHL